MYRHFEHTYIVAEVATVAPQSAAAERPLPHPFSESKARADRIRGLVVIDPIVDVRIAGIVEIAARVAVQDVRPADVDPQFLGHVIADVEIEPARRARSEEHTSELQSLMR